MEIDESAFQILCDNKKWDEVKEWIEVGGISPNIGDSILLRSAAQCGNFDMVKWVVEKGADLVDRMFGVNVAVRHAADIGRLDIIQYLVLNGAQPNEYGCGALSWAAEKGHFQVIRYLVEECKSDIHTWDECVLSGGIRLGRWDMIEYAISKGSDPARVHPRCVIDSALDGHWDVVDHLIKEYGILDKFDWRYIKGLTDKSVNAFLRMFSFYKHYHKMCAWIETPNYASMILMLVNVVKGTIPFQNESVKQQWKNNPYYDPHLGMLVLSYVD